jgi:hypothetical protein
MKPSSSESDSAEALNVEDASVDSSKKVAASTAGTEPVNHEEKPPGFRSTVHATSIEGTRAGDFIDDGVKLSEIRSSLKKVSNGVEKLATTVQDFFGLSDSDDDLSEDYARRFDGQWQLSWTKMKNNARRRRRRRLTMKNATASGNGLERDEHPTKHPEVVSDVRECNFEQFQSRRAGNSHKLYCVDVLIAGDELENDIRDFRETVSKIQSGKVESWKPVHVSDLKDESSPEGAGKKWIRRIRINSQAVLAVIRDLCPHAFGYGIGPVVFCRPFQLLVTLHLRMEEQLDNMRRLAHADTTAVAELACFVDFMEDRVMPDSRRYRNSSSSLSPTIRYEDLWYLYPPGDLVYVPRNVSGQDELRSTPGSPQIVRIIQTHLTPTSPNRVPIGISLDQNESWSFLGHFIEYDGRSFAPVHYVSDPFPPFHGETKVTELPAYPVSYLEDDEIMRQAIYNGRRYMEVIAERHGFYSGWTRPITPNGQRVTENSLGNRTASPEHIESDVLVDFEETFNAIPDWRPVFYQGVAEDEGSSNDTFKFEKSDLPVLEWDDTRPTNHDHFDRFMSEDSTEMTEAKKFMREDLLGQFRQHTRKAPTGSFSALLPSRFFAYAVLERRFLQLDTRFFCMISFESNDKAFDQLALIADYKRLILALVKSHFERIEEEKRRIEYVDVIPGKGRGVVILLHGVPGVGMTATAEAVALKFRKPLFPITCGDLGYTPETLERSLNQIFRLAHHWGCILLLDEADVFVTERARHDLKRNALVSGKHQNTYSVSDFIRQVLTLIKLSLRP